MTKRYDQKCEDLARYFLEEPGMLDSPAPDPDGVAKLAGRIQEAIESWLDEALEATP